MEPEGRELITAAAIARLAGVGRAAVSNWRKRYPEFPKPAGGSPNSPTFDQAEILTWLRETGKADQLATAGRTDGGTIRVGASSANAMDRSPGQAFDAMLAEEWKQLPERSISDLLPRDLLARTMVALLPRSIAPDRAARDDSAWPERPYDQDEAPSGSEPYRSDANDDPELPVVLDPACGAAVALMAAADRFGARIRLAGQDLDEKAARIAAFNLSGNSHGAPYEVHAGDSFTDSQLGAYLSKAAAVVCEPPFDRPDWPVAELTTDRRWGFGIPAPRDGELAWVQHCYAHLRPHGVAVAAVSQRICVQTSGEQIRAALVRTGVLRAVIALPRGMGSLPGTDICLWVLRRPGGVPDRVPVRMIDLSGLGDPADVPLEFGAWQQLFDGGDPAVSRAVERLELLDEGACLLPSRYLATRGQASAADLVQVTVRLAEIYAAVGRGLPRFAAPTTTSRHACVTLAELERVGALTIRARDDTPRAGDVLLRTQGRPPVVATAEKASDDDPIGRFVEVSGIAQIVEIDGTRLDPYFVALFLRSDVAALPVANTLGAINRDDLRRCRIARLPLADQRRYGEAFRRQSELEQALAALSDLSAKVIGQTVYALTTGAVAPEYETSGRQPGAGAGQTRDEGAGSVTVAVTPGAGASGPTHQRMAADIWSVADKLRGPYMRHEYGEVILPLTVLRRLDAVMAKTRQAVWDRDAALTSSGIQNKERPLQLAAKLSFYNTSKQDFSTIAADAPQVAKNLRDYIAGFSENVRKIVERFDLDNQITRMAESKILFEVVGQFAGMKDLEKLSTHDMGYVFEHLIRKFYEDANATAGEHFTPREVIHLMVNLLIAPDQDTVSGEGQVINILDPACGTGGMLTAAEDKIKSFNPNARVYLWGQELNPQSWATCGSEMLLRDQPGSIFYGNSFSNDGYQKQKFDYMLANPPFGVEWKTVKPDVEDEKQALGYAGRFGAGLPRINDGSFLFLQNMISKMEPVEGKGCRLAIVFNGSPLFTGAADSGESNIRKWILENDWLEGIVALPDQLFYNTGISTYFWILTNRKDPALAGKVILLDARDQWEKMRKSLGDKRKQIGEDQIEHITTVYGEALAVATDPEHPDHGRVKVFSTRDFGYQRITVERPLKQRFELTDDTIAALESSKALAKWDGRDALIAAFRGALGSVWWTKRDAEAGLLAAGRAGGALWPSSTPVLKSIWTAVSVSDPDGEVQTAKGIPLPDPDLRDYENVPLDEDVNAYFAREVLPHVPGAWIDHDKTKIGYEIPFTRHFYVYTPPRPLAEIDAELRDLESQIQKLLGEVTG